MRESIPKMIHYCWFVNQGFLKIRYVLGKALGDRVYYFIRRILKDE
jgi:hypothetical protein